MNEVADSLKTPEHVGALEQLEKYCNGAPEAHVLLSLVVDNVAARRMQCVHQPVVVHRKLYVQSYALPS